MYVCVCVCVCVCITESLGCTPEHNIVNQLYFNKKSRMPVSFYSEGLMKRRKILQTKDYIGKWIRVNQYVERCTDLSLFVCF